MNNDEMQAFEDLKHSGKHMDQSDVGSNAFDEEHSYKSQDLLKQDKDRSTKQFLPFRFFLIVISVSGILWTIYRISYYVDSFHFAAKSVLWPTTPATILSTNILTYNHYSENSGNKVYLYSMYQPVINYRYNVYGKQFTSSQFSLPSPTNQSLLNYRSDAEVVVRKFRAGQTVNIYYDPKDQKTAVIKPGVQSTDYNFSSIDVSVMAFTLWLPIYIAVYYYLKVRFNIELLRMRNMYPSGMEIFTGIFVILLPWLFISIVLSSVLPKLLFRDNVINQEKR